MSDEEAHREKEAEKAKVETWNQTQKVSEKEMSDKEARCEKETEKVKEDKVETWSQMQEKLPPPEVAKKRPGSSLQSSQQIKLVLRYPCDVCKHVSKTTEQLKKHMTIAHKGHKNTTWMFCGDCEYATRVEEEMVSHFLKKEAEKAKMETWGQTQKGIEKEMSDEESRCKKEAEKAKEREKEKEAEKAKEERRKRRKENLKELQKKLAKVQQAIKDAEGSEASEVSAEETDFTTPTSMPRKERKGEKKKKVRKANHSESSDEGCMKFTLQARNKVPTLEEGMTYAEYRTNVDWEKPEHIADHDANKPEDWDDEIDDPDHNPADTEGIAKYEENCKIGFDLWQVKSGTIFDKLIITDDPATAKKAGEDLWAVTKEAEKKMKDEQEEEERKKADEEAKKGEDDEDADDMDADEEDDIPEDENEEADEPDTGHSVPAPMECATLIRGLNLTDTQVHPIASRLSIRAVDREEQTVEVIKASTDTSSVLTEANEPEEIKEEENVNTAEDALGCKMREEDDKADEAPGAGTYGEKETTFLSQATSGNANATQLLDKNWMVGGADDSYITSCLCLYEYDRYVTTNNNETSRKGRERVDQFTYENYRQAGTVKAQAIEKNPVQSKTLVQAVERPRLLYHNKGEDNDTIYKMFKDKDEEENVGMAILDTGSAGSAAGRKWVEDHIENLCPEDKMAVRRREGKTYFKFGSGKRYKSQQRLVLPVYFAERRALMAIDMVDLHLPLLISLPAMKKAKTVIYTATDTANIYGQHLKLVKSDGHYTLSLRKGGAKIVAEESTDEENSATEEEDLENLMEEDPENLMVEVLVELGSWKEEVTKVHSQMCHASEKRTKSKLEGSSMMRHARHEDHIRVREEDEQELEKEADVVNQENDKQDEDEPHRKEDEMTKERVGGNSTGNAGAGFSETNPADNIETNPADGVVVFIDAAEGIRLNTERVIKQAVQEKPDGYYKLRDIVEEVNGPLSLYSESEEDTIPSYLARNVCGTSSQYGACPTQKSFAQVYNDTYGEINAPEFARRLWEDIYFTSETRKLAKKPLHGAARRNLVEFTLEPLHELFAQVGGNGNKSLPMLCEQLGIRLTKDEMKSSIRSLLRFGCSRFLGDFSGSTSMCEEHIPSPVENAKQKVGGTSETERYEDMAGYDQDGRLMVHTNKQYTTEDTICLQMLERFLSGTSHAGQEVRLLGENCAVLDEKDSRNRKVGRLWVYEARCRMDVNMVSPSNWIMIKGINQSIMKTATFTDMQGEEESGEHVIFGTGERYIDCVLQDLRKRYPKIEIRVADLGVSLCETVAETSSLKCFEEAPNKKNKMMMIAEPREKGPGEDTKNEAVSLNWNKKRLGEFPRIKVDKSCYNITRKTQVEVCKTDVRRNCEKFSNSYTLPAKEQTCRFELKKIYELEMKTHPKKTRKDRYTKDCKEESREICDQWDIQPLCDTQEGMVHIYETNNFTLPAKELIYRFELKKIYELQMKTHPKKTKKYRYIKEQPREIYDQGDIQPLCNTQERMVRTYEPTENGSWNQYWTNVRPKVCKTDAHRNCEKFSNSFTLPAKEQIYRFELKKIYELEMKTHPKKTRKDSYTKDCKEQSREICDQCDIQPLCDTQEGMVHIYETNNFTLPAKELIYRFEPKTIYELEMKTRPKKTKKDGYTKDCKEQPRVICDQCDIQPLCDTQERMVRIHETNRK